MVGWRVKYDGVGRKGEIVSFQNQFGAREHEGQLMAQIDELTELKELLDRCCHVPEMFVSERSIRHVETYLWAYAAGRSHGNLLNHCNYLRLFSIWLATKEKSPRNILWGSTLLQKVDGDDDLALSQAPILFATFIEECGKYTRKDWYDRFGDLISVLESKRWSDPSFDASKLTGPPIDMKSLIASLQSQERQL
jgi:hypothetical protein